MSDGLRVPTTYCLGMSRTVDLDYVTFLFFLLYIFFWWLTDFYLPFAVSKISKRLDLEPNMNKVRQAMSIPPDFREWRWLLSQYRMEECGLPQARAIEIWKLFSPDLIDQPDEMGDSSTCLSG